MQTKLRLGIEGPGNGTLKTSFVACINDLYMKLPRKMRQIVTLRLSSHIVRELWHSITNSNAMQVTWYNPLMSTPWRGSSSRGFLSISSRTCSSPDVSAEHTSLTTLLCEVKAMESSLQAFQNYKSDCAERPTAPRNTSNSNSHNSSNNWMPRVVRLLRGNKGATLQVTPNISVTEG